MERLLDEWTAVAGEDDPLCPVSTGTAAEFARTSLAEHTVAVLAERGWILVDPRAHLLEPILTGIAQRLAPVLSALLLAARDRHALDHSNCLRARDEQVARELRRSARLEKLVPSGGDASPAHEVERLRGELERLRQRRSVRAALAVVAVFKRVRGAFRRS